MYECMLIGKYISKQFEILSVKTASQILSHIIIISFPFEDYIIIIQSIYYFISNNI